MPTALVLMGGLYRLWFIARSPPSCTTSSRSTKVIATSVGGCSAICCFRGVEISGPTRTSASPSLRVWGGLLLVGIATTPASGLLPREKDGAVSMMARMDESHRVIGDCLKDVSEHPGRVVECKVFRGRDLSPTRRRSSTHPVERPSLPSPPFHGPDVVWAFPHSSADGYDGKNAGRREGGPGSSYLCNFVPTCRCTNDDL